MISKDLDTIVAAGTPEMAPGQTGQGIDLYSALVNDQGRLVLKVNDFHLGYIVDAPFFSEVAHDWFTPEEIHVIAKFEEYTQGIMSHSPPRKFSGLHPYSYIYRDAETAFRIAKKAGVPLDFKMVMVLIGHDVIEERPRVKELLDLSESPEVMMDEGRRIEVSGELELATSHYESGGYVSPGFVEIVSAKIEYKKKGDYYYMITPDGLIRRWVQNDVAGSRFIRTLDSSDEGKGQVYEDARNLAVIIPMFGMFYEKKYSGVKPALIKDPEVRFNPEIHNYFTLDGVQNMIREIGKDFWVLAQRLTMAQYFPK